MSEKTSCGRKYFSEKNLIVSLIWPLRSDRWPLEGIYTETFIKNIFEYLPASVHLLYGGHFPTHYADGKPLLSASFPRRVFRKGLRMILRVPEIFFQERALRRFLKVTKTRAVLAEYGPTGVAVMKVCQRVHMPLVVHFHGFDVNNKNVLNELGNKYAVLFQSGAAIVACSKYLREQLIKLGAPADKVFVNYCGVDTNLFHKANPALAGKTFLSVARFVDNKGPYLTLMAFKKVAEKHPDARLVMVGDGKLRESCEKIATAYKIRSAVEFPGACPPQEVPFFMQKAIAFLQHSVQAENGDCEGLPVTILEAGASGLPVVSTRLAGIPEAVLEGKTGFLVDEYDVDKMAEHMIFLFENPDIAQKIGDAAQEHIHENFSLEKSLAGLREIIELSIQKYTK